MAIAAGATNGTKTPKPTVLIPEKVSPDGLALLQKTLNVHEKKGLSPEELIKIIPGMRSFQTHSKVQLLT
jgi:D-3-phosphoglycerate dehydrogenase / 2-oxoglutarate reductase